MNEEAKDKIYTAITAAIILLVIACGLVKAAPRYRQYCALKESVGETERRIAEVKRRSDELADKQKRFETDREFVESIARQNHRVHPGEFVFVFSGQERQ